jgi:hypothetical protein
LYLIEFFRYFNLKTESCFNEGKKEMLFLTFYKKILELKSIKVAVKRNATQLTPVEPHGQVRLTFYPPSLWRTGGQALQKQGGQACREPFGLETCRRASRPRARGRKAHVESLRAERPPGRTTRGTDKTLHFVLPQMLTELA